MFALKSAFGSGKARRTSRLPVDIGTPGAAAADRAGRVLPRFLRRPVRLAARLLADGAGAPRYAATVMTAMLLGAVGLYGAILGGHMPKVVQAVTARTGFAIEDIRISGRRHASEIDVLGELDLNGRASLLGYGAEAAREKIAGLPWVASVSIRKTYPSTLEIRIVEREPFAIWQNGSKLALVEQSGNVIVAYPGGQFSNLPLIVGPGAPEKAPNIIEQVSTQPRVADRVKAFIRVADRRWNLRLENGITVRLPANGARRAIADLAGIDRRDALLDRDIAAVDLRFGDRMVVRLTPEALEARAAALKEPERQRRREKKI